MKCKKVKRLLLTDYIDNEIDEKIKEVVDKHLIACRNCFNFKNDLEKKLSVLKTTKQITAPDFLWYNFKEKLEATKETKQKLFPLINLEFKKLINRAIPITVGISILLLSLFFTSNTVKRRQLLYKYIGEQIDFLTTITSGEEIEYNNFNSDIEYLL
ncbi:MAG: zf-HC2 domain-containing protein [Candidatus Omnitrophica bacterium]|nr:zf-HC2 domain-containing protein [Candidatus Omnitrophota bacterium]